VTQASRRGTDTLQVSVRLYDCALWKLSPSWNGALSAHETGRSDLAVIRLCGTQQTIYFTAGNHDPPALSNRFDCAPVELAVSPGLMFSKQGGEFSGRIRDTVVERRLLVRFVVLFHATQYSSASAKGCSIRDAIEVIRRPPRNRRRIQLIAPTIRHSARSRVPQIAVKIYTVRFYGQRQFS
jgi:hypothetical protein